MTFIADHQTSDLPRRLAADDRQAFEAIYRRHRQNLLNFVRNRYRWLDDHAVEDVASESFLRLWERRHGLRITHNVLNYLKSVAKSAVVDQHRQRRVCASGYLSADVPSLVPSPDVAMDRKELSQRITSAMASLAESHRFALEQARLGLSSKEIALRLGCTENAARHIVQKARKNLARVLSHCGDSCAVSGGRPEQCQAEKENISCLKWLYIRELHS